MSTKKNTKAGGKSGKEEKKDMPVEEDKEEQVPPEELDPSKLMSIPFEILANKGGPTLH
jgi:hypothetical protein